jgi:DNA-binding NarL/FixJ family response regulator
MRCSIGEAGKGRQALEKFPDHRPQLTGMDFLMPEMNALEAARQLTERNPDALILMVTTDPSSPLEEEAKPAGIRGLCAQDKMQSLASAINTVIHGGTYFSEDVAA